MAKSFRWLLRIFAGLVILIAIAIGGVWYFVSRSLPDYDATEAVAGLGAEVEIVRDAFAVPHIFGASDADVFFGLGYAHAQDRLWQMSMLRRTAQGRLSEIFGARTLGIDDFIRRLDVYGLSERSLAYQTPGAKAALEAYARGVNARIAVVNARAAGRGAPEFFLFPQAFEPWRPADSLSVIRLMGLRLASHLEEEVLRARVSDVVAPERLADILPVAPGTGAFDVASYRDLFPTFADRGLNRPRDPLDPSAERGFAGASNAFAASPGRSVKGASLLASDPHLGLTAPSIWMPARLEFPDGGVIGGTIPGLPAVLVGRNAHVGWGLTTAYLDDQDVFIERLNPDDPNQYLTPDGYRPFRTATTEIAVKDAEAVEIVLRWSENGPIIPGARFDLSAVTPAGHVAALGWTLLAEDDASVSAAVSLMRSKSVNEVLAAGGLFKAPAQILTVADRDNIAMQLIGAMVKRDAAHQTQGRMPAPGWAPQNRWQGIRPYAANPRTLNPASGLLAHTNNKMDEAPFPDNVSDSWGDTQRIERIRALMAARDVQSRESMTEYQLDTVSFTARALLPLIAGDLWAGAVPTTSALRQAALARLASWNGEMNEHLPEPLIYAAWVRALQARLAGDELGELAGEFTHADPVFIERVFRNVDGAAVWCDIRGSSKQEACAEVAALALDDALAGLAGKYGATIADWRWGEAHVATHDHEVLGSIPILSLFVNIRQSTSGGDNTLMRGRTAGTGENPYRNVHGSGYRGVYDFADPESSTFIISTGVSGHPLSRHYDDLAQLWRRGEYIPMRLDPALARAGAVGITRLRPAP